MTVRSLIVWGMVLATSCLAAAPAAAEYDRMKTVCKVQPFVVLVEARDGAGTVVSRGSGLLLGASGDVVTLAGTVLGTARQEVVTADGKRRAVRGIAAESDENALVLLALESPGVVGLPVAASPAVDPAAGDEIVVLGASGGTRSQPAPGVVTAVRRMPLFGRVTRLDAAVPDGSLGGPVIDRRGDVLGIVATHALAGPGAFFVIPWEAVLHLWQRNGKAEERARIEAYGAEAVRLYRSGIAFLLEERYPQAQQDFGQASRLAPAWAGAEFLHGYAALENGRPDLASESIQRAARLDSANLEISQQLGRAYARIRCFQDAAEAFERAIALSPREFDAYLSASYAYGRLGWHEKAKFALQRAVVSRCGTVAPGEEDCVEEQFARLEEVLAAERTHLWTEDVEADLAYQRGLAYLTVARMDMAREAYRSLQKRDAVRAARLLLLLTP